MAVWEEQRPALQTLAVEAPVWGWVGRQRRVVLETVAEPQPEYSLALKEEVVVVVVVGSPAGRSGPELLHPENQP